MLIELAGEHRRRQCDNGHLFYAQDTGGIIKVEITRYSKGDVIKLVFCSQKCLKRWLTRGPPLSRVIE